MTSYPPHTQFKYPWRKYQQRVLDELEDHLADRHLHVIAPPGSGKTVLGLEVAIRINKPTLILAPTIAIRNQWIQRFCELFLQATAVPEWISTDIRNPAFMTVVTYQGLHAACNNLRIEEEDTDDPVAPFDQRSRRPRNTNLAAIVRGLKAANISTIVVDEAHHLKNEWWHTLSKVKEKIDPIVVGLTATPPYDVTATEWQRYINLNGPVDTEISIPELVIEGDLCPHQDYVFFTKPTADEHQTIVRFRENVTRFFADIRTDEILMQAITQHPIWQQPSDHLEWIYSNLSYYSACLIYLHSTGRAIPETHLEVIGDKDIAIPAFDYDWAEVLLDFYLFKEELHFTDFDAYRKALEHRLRRYGVIERRQINFLHNRRITRSVTSSISKLDGIQEIVDFEYAQLRHDLRLVVLCDYIRKEFFVPTPINDVPLDRLGVMPVFEKLRRNNVDGKKIGVLTGSIIIIPVVAFPVFQAKAAKYGITHLASSPVPFDHDYLLISQTPQLKNDIVHIITQVFQQGEIEVLIGTKSLLGEGWDAPAINALILASFVGSFVLSNQMRGRAIRTQRDNPDKTGNIWHLVCVDPTSPQGGDDVELLQRRFRSFVGVSFRQEAGIENGLGRLDLPRQIGNEGIGPQNAKMLAYAADRGNLKEQWKTALKTGNTLIEEIKIPFTEKREYKTVVSLHLHKTLARLTATLAFMVFGYLELSVDILSRIWRNFDSAGDFYTFFWIFLVIGMLSFGGGTYHVARLYFRYRDISADIHRIGEALLHALSQARALQTNLSQLHVETSIDQSGAIFCHLEGGTTFDKSFFINALQEVIGPVRNPRYVIIRKNIFMRVVEQRDYHAVPEMLGRNKSLAEYFKDQWEYKVGGCELIFTRTIEGRKLLLKSRIKSLAAQFEKEIEHVSKWR